jgi:SAM-dependent methyltransferase
MPNADPTPIRKSVEEFAKELSPGSSVLDVGCGLRQYEECFEGREYVGLDVEESGRDASEKRADTYFNGLDIPYEDGNFDAAICNEVLEHAIDPSRLLSEIHRVLRPGGRILVTVPFIWGEHEIPFDFRRYSSFGIEREFQQAGFEVEVLSKLKQGIGAIDMLVKSEINNYEVNVLEPIAGRIARWRRRLTQRFADRVWRLQLRLWTRLYRFERIHIDNLVIAVKPARAD